MKSLKTGLLWLALLSKRLYRRPSFLLILLLIPVLVLGYSTIATEDSGMVTVALAQEGQEPLAEELLEGLQQRSQLLLYRRCASADEARELVATGKVDTAWIFPEDLEQSVQDFVAAPSTHPFIRVLVREDSVMLRLSRESLSGNLFSQVAQDVYLVFVRQLAPELDTLSDQELLDIYDQVEISDNLFSFDDAYAQVVQTHYLLSPVRGFLGILIVLCALAAAMYSIRDIRQGTFCRVSLHKRWAAELAGQLVAVVHVAAASALCMLLTGMATDVVREIALLLLFSLCCSAFAMALRRLFGSLRALAALLPALIVLMLVVCPVFFDLNALRLVRLLFPPTYYIFGAHNPAYLWYMVLYTLGCFGVYGLVGLLPSKRETE